MNRFEIKHVFPHIEPGAISFQPMLAQFHEGITIFDADGFVLYMNQAQAKIDDLDIEDTIGKKVTTLYRVDEGFSPAMACLKTGTAIKNLACFYRTHLGRVVNSIHNLYPITAKGRLIGAICYITDYRNIEHTFDTVMKSQPTQSLPTYGVTRPVDATQHGKNGTRYTFADIVGKAPDMLAAVKSAKLSSESTSPILIFGKTGTGKELLAQSIHNRSSRKNHPYLAINCATIPENLLEGMLFGTSTGAFTGAINKAGLFEMAAGGTLLLDEINSMPLNLQAKLLRFLQERKVRRIGSMKETHVDLKIISSINVLPHRAIEAGTLRADLFYRLAVVFIHIPPLAERKADLSRLIPHFLDRKNQQMAKRVTGIAMDVMEYFERYEWPGNVRELEHVIEGAMNLVGTDKVIEMRHLTVPFHSENQGASADPSKLSSATGTSDRVRLFSSSPMEKTPTGKTLAEMKREYEIATIIASLRDTQGNAARAARKLGISPQSMNYKLRRLKIDRKEYI